MNVISSNTWRRIYIHICYFADSSADTSQSIQISGRIVVKALSLFVMRNFVLDYYLLVLFLFMRLPFSSGTILVAGRKCTAS